MNKYPVIENIFLSLITMIVFTKCAQIVPLTGGQRDTHPPKILNISPNNYTKNFSSKKIYFTFNEKIQLINPNDNIIIVPSLSKKLEWNIKNKTIELYLPDSLQNNITYKIIFNKTIADLAEKNTVPYYEYVFSTGNYIDSFYIKGNVKNAFTLNNEKNTLIALYNESENDSVVLKNKPLYFTKSDENGNFIIKNLPDSKFKIYAYSDINNNFKYDPVKEKIDLKKYSMNPEKDSIINFFISEEYPSKIFLKKVYLKNNYQIHLIYSYPDKYKILNPSNRYFILNDSLNYSDTCKIMIYNTDTAHLIIKNSTDIDTIITTVRKQKHSTNQFNINYLHNSLHPFFLPIVLTSDFWIDTNQTKNKILLYKKSDSLNPLSIKSIQYLPDKIIIPFPLEPNTTYILKTPIIPIDTKDSIVYQKIEFKTNNIENYSQLKINILFPDKKKYIVALCNLQHKIIYSKNISIPIAASNQQSIEFKNVLPDNYILKIIQDDNQNNKWDTHSNILNSSKRHFAEIFYIYPKPIKLINNWDVNLDWKEVK